MSPPNRRTFLRTSMGLLSGACVPEISAMSGPNSWCPVRVCNYWGADITNVRLNHRYDNDHYDEKSWPLITDGGASDPMPVGFWTGFGRTGRDYWHISFDINGATWTCKDNFYCFLTKSDVGKTVRIEIRPTSMKVVCPVSSGCDVTLDANGSSMANKDKGFYNIAHMVNSVEAAQWGVGQGANGLEADLNFDNGGTPTVFKHGGIVSDCTCNPLPSDRHVCRVIGKDTATSADILLRSIPSDVALFIVDSKITDDVNLSAAGANVVRLLERHLFGNGYKGNTIVSVGETRYAPYIAAAARAAADSPFLPRISFTFDGEGDNCNAVFAALNGIVSEHRVYGTGITVCSPAHYYPAIVRSSLQEHRGFLGLSYIWTLDSPESMRTYIRCGARGILTNMPGVLNNVLGSMGITLALPGSLIPRATLNSF